MFRLPSMRIKLTIYRMHTLGIQFKSDVRTEKRRTEKRTIGKKTHNPLAISFHLFLFTLSLSLFGLRGFAFSFVYIYLLFAEQPHLSIAMPVNKIFSLCKHATNSVNAFVWLCSKCVRESEHLLLLDTLLYGAHFGG